MFYERIVIAGCTRFSVSGRYYIEVKPSAKVQMILGTNGSGKSSFAQLGFSPLPINHKWMKPDGYFIKEGTYKGDRYYLEGRYGSKVTFTFKKNDEVLLDNGSITPYLDLVRIHLDYTRWLHDLLLGKIKFTDLGPVQRQDFLSKISNSDFTQVFKLLTSYKKLHGHYLSVGTFLQGRINEESSRLLDEEELKQHQKLKEQLQAEIEEVQAIPSLDIRNVDLQASYTQLQDIINKQLYANHTNPVRESLEALKEFEADNVRQLNEVQGQLSLISTDLQNLTQKLGFIENSDENKSELMEELKVMTKELKSYDKLPGDIPVEYFTKNAGVAVDSLTYVLGNLTSEVISQQKEHDLRHDALNKDKFLNQCEFRLEQIQRELSRIENIELLSCPACNHEFKPGVDPEMIKDLTKRREIGFEYVAKATAEHNLSSSELNDYLEKKQMYEGLHHVRNTYRESHSGLFTYIDTLGGLDKGKELISHLHVYKQFCDTYHRKLHILSKVERLSSIAKRADEMEHEKDYLAKLVKEKSDFFNSLTDRRNELMATSKEVDRSFKEVDYEEANMKLILQRSNEFYSALDNELEKVKQRIKKESLDELLGRLANVHNTLNEQSIVQSLLDDFNSQLITAKKKSTMMKQVVDILSPKTGLIAEQLSLSVGAWLDGLNQLVDKVWGYPLEIRLGQVGDNGLDYKFPMRDSEQERDDVSEGSDSMLEMVNRAVVMMSYFSLDLSDMPLFLDEPGRTFDKTHKLNLIPLIRDLTDSVRFSQIVLISHSEDVQTAFPNSETLILDERNISYPHPFNEHVTFESIQE